ncbi:cell division control protein 14, SIN component-domain-containing protein [Jimgerdemannia flammicorona]|uniref:Cell division control protein 14, SIN component-domain-containing protein n=1 Tax=Jimgerdemannia flammicorona TaxID=994334 RepID=A0A433QGP9_9FUNG|nr:cell division control protein 14, SIN component-domain-containing protein [Jimgerdemannia flammicorona]
MSRVLPLLEKVIHRQRTPVSVDGPTNKPVTDPNLMVCPRSALVEQIELMLNAVQGLCLIHVGSRRMFAQNNNMKVVSCLCFVNTLLLLLENPSKAEPSLLRATLDTLICILADSSENTRLFERVGMATVTQLLKNRNVGHDVR